MTEIQSFNLRYGPYMELIYLISQGDLLKKKEIENMNVHEFLWAGQYLILKRRIEAKHNRAKQR